MSYPRKYPTSDGTALAPQDWNIMVDLYQGFTPEGVFRSPYQFLIDTNVVGGITYYYAYNAFQLIYGGPGNAGGVDGTNAAAVIQAALDGLTSGRTWKEKVLVKKNCIINSKLSIPSYTILEINGVLKAKDGLNDTLIENIDPTGGNTDIEICGGVIDGNHSNQASPTDDKITVHMKNVTNLLIHDLTLINGWTSGIRTYDCNHFIIANNIIDDVADDAIAVNEDSRYGVVANNICMDSGQTVSYGSPHGIEVQDNARYIAVIGNYIEHPLGYGIEVSVHSGKTKCYSIDIIGNLIYNAGGGGIHVEGTSGQDLTSIKVTGNVIDGGGSSAIGIELDFLTQCKISDNYVYDCVRGIRLDSTGTNSYNEVTNNFVAKHDYDGIRLNSAVQYCRLNENVVQNVGEAEAGSQVGIAVYADYNEICRNRCEDTRSGASRTQQYGLCLYSGGDNNRVIDNILQNNSVGQLVDSGANNILKRNLGEITTQGLYQEYTAFQNPTGTFDAGDVITEKETTGGTARLYIWDGSAWHYINQSG